ncbi:MAG: iron-sulfur cluster assembly scaffold protein [bacterium]|nr:iron-sulfur cluster assembly scaffold protein [bacterium]
MAWDYTDKLKEHFFNPLNILEVSEEEYNADGVGEVGNIKCGDMMRFYIKVGKDGDKDIISDCKWKTYGCASAIASTSVLSDMVIGMPIEEAVKLVPNDIVKVLGGIPEQKFHCSVLGDKALRAAVENYYEKTGQTDKIFWKRREIICHCLDVDRAEIESLFHNENVRTFEELQERTKIGTSCGACIEKAKALLKSLEEEDSCSL